ncbi:MAG: long-chain-fatty-acid--CoA ligase, partial [Omnitrophica WOR_2 bacterium]
DLLQETAAKYPGRPCARFFGKQYSYSRINNWADRCAAGLQKMGVQPGDKVILLLPNSHPFIIAYYGILKAGAVVVPINPLSSSHELSFFIDNSGAETVITIPLFAKKASALQQQAAFKRLVVAPLSNFLPFPLSWLQGLQEWRLMQGVPAAGLYDFMKLLRRALPSGFQPQPADPGDLAIILYSGGTTGAARAIMLSHFNCVANACQLKAWGDLNPDQRVLSVLPLFHGFGMSLTMNVPILVGGEIILHPRFNVRDILASIQKDRPNFFVGVPTMFVAFINTPGLERFDLTSLQGVFVGGAPLTQAVKDGFESKTGGRMIEGYGLTEAVTAIMGNPLQGLHKPGSIGLPFSDVEAKIVDLQDGRDLSPNESGEILLRSPTLMMGYYHNQEETGKAIVDGWLHTGDIGHMDEDGYFYITDRKKELIITGGFNVFPREIHEVLYQHPKVKEGVAIGLPDPYLGERIKVFAVLKEGETATPEELIAFFKERLIYYKVPAEIEFRQELPKSMIGKILPRVLQEEEAQKARNAG